MSTPPLKSHKWEYISAEIFEGFKRKILFYKRIKLKRGNHLIRLLKTN